MSSVLADLLTNNLSHSPHDLDSDTDDFSSLPFPQPLSQSIFSAPDFNTETFLLSHSQFRTLDDLRSELRSWVNKLENEMETLIEEDWNGYLSLGKGLAGGDTFVKEAERQVRQVDREIQTVKRRIEERIKEVDATLEEKAQIRRKADFARRLLAIHYLLQTLEKGLLLQPNEHSEPGDSISLFSREWLQQLVSQYRELTYFITRIPSTHPFLVSLLPRIEKVKATLKRNLQDAIASKRKEDNNMEAFILLRLGSSTDLDILPLN